MKIQIIKKKESSLKELGKEEMEIPHVSSLKELLIVILHNEYQKIHHQQMKILNENDIQQLAHLGKISFSTLYNDNQKDLDEMIHIMIQDFEDGLYRVYINGNEYNNIDDQIQLNEDDEVVFLRFVMLAGRLW